MVWFACLQFLYLSWQYNLDVKMASNFLRKKNRYPRYFKRKQDGLDEIGVLQSFLERTAWVIYRRIILLIEDTSINFIFHQELLFRTSDFHSMIHKLYHSRNVYDFKTNITPIKHAWLTDNNKNHSCFKESTNNGDGTPLPYWWIIQLRYCSLFAIV